MSPMAWISLVGWVIVSSLATRYLRVFQTPQNSSPTKESGKAGGNSSG